MDFDKSVAKKEGNQRLTESDDVIKNRLNSQLFIFQPGFTIWLRFTWPTINKNNRRNTRRTKPRP